MMQQVIFERGCRTRTQEQTADLAIIGGGPACVALLHRLARAGHSKSIGHIDVFEKRKHLGPGGPYAPPDRALLMNTPVSHLNVTGDPRHLTHWLATCALPGAHTSLDVCLPRFVYGHYLEHVGSAAIKRLAYAKTQVTHRRHEVRDLSQVRGNQFELTASDGNTFYARRVVLAVGDPAPTRHAAFEGLPNYVDAPTRFEAMAAIPRDAAVIVLGAGASAVDCCLYLKRNRGHCGLITLVSRSGQLPCVLSNHLPDGGVPHDHVAALLASQSGVLSLTQVVKAVESDLSAWLGGPASVYSKVTAERTAERIFYRDVLRASHRLPGPQDYIRSLRKLAPEVWRRLLPEDRRLFDENYRSQWDRHRHPIPVSSARTFMRMLRLGEVRVVKASYEALSLNGDFTVQASGVTSQAVQAPYLVQATGLELDATRDSSHLIKAILRRDLGCAHPSGGLRVNSKLKLQRSQGEESDVYLMGSRTRGSTFATASIQSIARASETVAEQLVLDNNKSEAQKGRSD